MDFAKKCLDEPSLLLTSDSQHLQQIKRCAAALVSLSSFVPAPRVGPWGNTAVQAGSAAAVRATPRCGQAGSTATYS